MLISRITASTLEVHTYLTSVSKTLAAGYHKEE